MEFAPVWVTFKAGPVPAFWMTICSVLLVMVFKVTKSPKMDKFEAVTVPCDVILPVDRRLPWTWNASLGRVVPMPTWRVLVSTYNPGVAML